MMNEYRVTRDTLYANPHCVGHKDLTARDGHYIKAASQEDALMEMKKRYPHDVHGFTVQFWKGN